MKTTLGAVAAVIAVLAVSGCASTAPAPAGGGFVATDEAGRAAQEIRRACLARPRAEAMSCYEEALLGVLRVEGVRPAMTVLDRLAEADPGIRRDGHVYAHVIGLAAFTTAEEVGETYASCTPAFQSGCYHGVIQSYFVDHARRHGDHLDAATVDGLCADYRGDEAQRWQLFQCAHGLGHGLTMVLGYHLPRALEACDLVESPWEREACYAGAFMENIVQATVPHHTVGRPDAAGAGHHAAGSHAHHAAPQAAPAEHAGHAGHAGHDAHAGHGDPAPEAFRGLDPADPHYPCSILDVRYLRSCYQMQTSAVLFFQAGDFAAAVRLCREAPELYRDVCYESLGRDVSSYVQQDHSRALRICGGLEARYAPSCHVGYTKNLIDLTAEVGDGIAYCRRVRDPASKQACYLAVGEQIAVLAPSPAARDAGCAAVEPGFAPVCRYGAGLTEERPALPTGPEREAGAAG
jgi:hypothetical protein